jgi:transcriptional regulator with XRE-family HTH domain
MAIGRRRGRGIPLRDVDRRRIIAARQRLGLSVQDLAKLVGMHQSTVYRLENGSLRSTPRLTSVYEALQLPPELIGRADADEEELLMLYRAAKERDPRRAQLIVETLRRWHVSDGVSAEAATDTVPAGVAAC